MPLLLAWTRPGSVSVQSTLLAACLLLGVGLCAPSSSNAQRRALEAYSLEDGLPQSQVQDVIQGERGYLWFALLGGGPVQFDGHTFTAFTSADGLPSDLITALYQDTSGVLWVGTRRGLFHFDGSTYERRSATASLTMTHHSLEVAERSPADCTFHQCETQGAKRR